MSFNIPGGWFSPASTPQVETPPLPNPVGVPAPQTPTGLEPQTPRPNADRNSTAPRNALPKGLVTGMRYGLNATAKVVGGPIGYLAKVASGALGGVANAGSVKEAAVGAALGAARAAIGSGTPIGAAIKITQLTMGLVTGSIEPRNAMVQGFGAALDLAAGLVPGPVGHAARLASTVLSTANSVDEAVNMAAGAARAGETLLGHIAYAATMVSTASSASLMVKARAPTFIGNMLPESLASPETLEMANKVASYSQMAGPVAKNIADAADKMAALTGSVAAAQKAAAGRILDTGAATLGAVSDGASSFQQATANMLKTTAEWFKRDSAAGSA